MKRARDFELFPKIVAANPEYARYAETDMHTVCGMFIDEICKEKKMTPDELATLIACRKSGVQKFVDLGGKPWIPED